ncbi:hypothetical protein C2W62_51260, partial [Candidatus Entotheonella serta]
MGGAIALTRPIRIREPNSWLTVAGQSAPGDGIELRNYGLKLSDGCLLSTSDAAADPPRPHLVRAPSRTTHTDTTLTT